MKASWETVQKVVERMTSPVRTAQEDSMANEIPEHLVDVAKALPPLATIPEACAALRMGATTVRGLVRAGQLRAIRSSPTGSARLLIPRSEILRYLESRTID